MVKPFEQFPHDAPQRGARPQEDVAHRRALSLTFRFQKASVELVLMEPIEMIVPPSLDLTGEPPGAMFWFEIEGAGGTPLYRRVQRNPLGPTVEVTTGNPERPLAHVNSGRTDGEFTLLVPDLPRAQAIVLYTLTVNAADRDQPPSTTAIARFPLGDAIGKEAIARDTIPPRTVSDAVAAYGDAAVIHLRAHDNLGPVAATFYRLDEGEERQGLTVTVDRAGLHTLTFWSVDRAGNIEPENRVTFSVGPYGKQGAV